MSHVSLCIKRNKKKYLVVLKSLRITNNVSHFLLGDVEPANNLISNIVISSPPLPQLPIVWATEIQQSKEMVNLIW